MKTLLDIIRMKNDESVDCLISNQNCFVISEEELNEIKAEAIRQVADETKTDIYADDSKACKYNDLICYANHVGAGLVE